jgi:Uma2 family endonuclease
MPTLITPGEQKVELHGVSWRTYELLLADYNEVPGTHFIYDQGALEIIIPSMRHHHLNRVLAFAVFLIACELDIDSLDIGSTTFRNEHLQKGIEPDTALSRSKRRDLQNV